MSEVLGVLDALEATILEGQKVPFTEKVLLNEKQLIDLIDKLRVSLSRMNSNSKNDNSMLKIDKNTPEIENQLNNQKKAADIQHENKIKQGANEYAEYILSSLLMTVTKMQKNLVRLEQSIESGRNLIEKKQTEENLNDRVENEIIH